MPPVPATFLTYGVKWQGQVEITSWAELNIGFLPGSVCPLGPQSFHLQNGVILLVISAHLPCASWYKPRLYLTWPPWCHPTWSPLVDSCLPKIQSRCPAKVVMMLTVSVWNHLVWWLSCDCLCAPHPGMRASWSPLHLKEPIHWFQRGGPPFLFLAAFASGVFLFSFFDAVLLSPGASLKWESGDAGSSLSPATSWLSALKTVTYLLWASFLTCKENSIFVRKGCHDKLSQTGTLKHPKCIFSQFWRLEV